MPTSRSAAIVPIFAVAAVLLASAPTSTEAQTPVVTPGGQPCSYDSCVLRVEDGWFSRHLVRGPEGTVVARLGWGGPSLEQIVAISDSAVAHARRYRTAQNTGAVLTTVGSLGTIAAILILNESDRDVRDEAMIANAAGLVVWGIGNSYLLKARRELSRSLWWYNRTVLAGR